MNKEPIELAIAQKTEYKSILSRDAVTLVGLVSGFVREMSYPLGEGKLE
jgi:hypothetical protein